VPPCQKKSLTASFISLAITFGSLIGTWGKKKDQNDVLTGDTFECKAGQKMFV
jgi:hypothetical protein